MLTVRSVHHVMLVNILLAKVVPSVTQGLTVLEMHQLARHAPLVLFRLKDVRVAPSALTVANHIETEHTAKHAHLDITPMEPNASSAQPALCPTIIRMHATHVLQDILRLRRVSPNAHPAILAQQRTLLLHQVVSLVVQVRYLLMIERPAVTVT